MRHGIAAWWREFVRRYRAVRLASPSARRLPLAALVIAVAVFAAAVATRPFFSKIDPATYSSLGWRSTAVLAGEWWRIPVAGVLSRDPFMTIAMMVGIFIEVGFYERVVGSIRAFWVAVSGAWFGYASITFLLWILRPLGWPLIQRTMSTLDVGFSAGVVACWAGLIAFVRYRPATWTFVLLVVGGLVVHHQVADWMHAITALTYYHVLARLGPRYLEVPSSVEGVAP
jgi:hypothetical protein